MNLRLTKVFAFEMAHALSDYPGKCHNIHGHTYRLAVTVGRVEPLPADTLPGNGLVMDFHQLKELVERVIVAPFDHALLLSERSPFRVDGGTKLIRTPFEPTTENLLLHFRSLLVGQLPPEVRLCSLRLAETDTSYAELDCSE